MLVHYKIRYYDANDNNNSICIANGITYGASIGEAINTASNWYMLNPSINIMDVQAYICNDVLDIEELKDIISDDELEEKQAQE